MFELPLTVLIVSTRKPSPLTTVDFESIYDHCPKFLPPLQTHRQLLTASLNGQYLGQLTKFFSMFLAMSWISQGLT